MDLAKPPIPLNPAFSDYLNQVFGSEDTVRNEKYKSLPRLTLTDPAILSDIVPENQKIGEALMNLIVIEDILNEREQVERMGDVTEHLRSEDIHGMYPTDDERKSDGEKQKNAKKKVSVKKSKKPDFQTKIIKPQTKKQTLKSKKSDENPDSNIPITILTPTVLHSRHHALDHFYRYARLKCLKARKKLSGRKNTLKNCHKQRILPKITAKMLADYTVNLPSLRKRNDFEEENDQREREIAEEVKKLEEKERLEEERRDKEVMSDPMKFFGDLFENPDK